MLLILSITIWVGYTKQGKISLKELDIYSHSSQIIESKCKLNQQAINQIAPFLDF